MRSVVTSLTRLKTEFGIDGKGLVSFMCGSVACRLADESFWASLTRLYPEFGKQPNKLGRMLSKLTRVR